MGAVSGPWASGSPGSLQCPGGATLSASGRVRLRRLVLGYGAALPRTGCCAPARLCTDHKSSDSCLEEAAPAPLRQNGLRQERGAQPSPGTPQLWHLTPSRLQRKGGSLGRALGTAKLSIPVPSLPWPPWASPCVCPAGWHHRVRGSWQPECSQHGAPVVLWGTARDCEATGRCPQWGH